MIDVCRVCGVPDHNYGAEVPDLRVRFEVRVEFLEDLSVDEGHAYEFNYQLDAAVYARFAADPALRRHTFRGGSGSRDDDPFASFGPLVYDLRLDFPEMGYTAMSDPMVRHEMNLGLARCSDFGVLATQHFDPQRCPPAEMVAWQPSLQGFRSVNDMPQAASRLAGTEGDRGAERCPPSEPLVPRDRVGRSTVPLPRVRTRTVLRQWASAGLEFG